jgi:hypothetical protein
MLDQTHTPFVIGPASDGGFWLFGGRAALPRNVWTRVRYSQPRAASELQQQVAVQGAVSAIGCLTDVDNAENLPALRRALEALDAPQPAQQRLLAWLTNLPR